MWFSKAGMSCAELEKLDSSPGRYNSACPARKRRIWTDVHANRVFVCWSPLACLQGAGALRLLRRLMPSFRSSPVLQRSTETAGWSVFKSLVCHLNEAFRAQKKKKSTRKYHNVLSISSHFGCFRNVLVLLLDLLSFPASTHKSPGPLSGERRHEIDMISLNTAQIWR